MIQERKEVTLRREMSQRLRCPYVRNEPPLGVCYYGYSYYKIVAECGRAGQGRAGPGTLLLQQQGRGEIIAEGGGAIWSLLPSSLNLRVAGKISCCVVSGPAVRNIWSSWLIRSNKRGGLLCFLPPPLSQMPWWRMGLSRRTNRKEEGKRKGKERKKLY